MNDTAVTSFPIEPAYGKPNGQCVQDIDRTDLPLGFTAVERSLITMPPGQVGGNHSHSRREGFIAIGTGLTIYWLDADNRLQSMPMNPGGELRLVVVQSMVPHAVRNESDRQAVLLEYADQTRQESSFQKADPELV